MHSPEPEDTALAEDAFGHPYSLDALCLPRNARGYGVQRLDTDTLLDRRSGEFLPVRDAQLDACHGSFAAARDAACAWVRSHGGLPEEQPLAIVPVGYDQVLDRHVLIHGVLKSAPD